MKTKTTTVQLIALSYLHIAVEFRAIRAAGARRRFAAERLDGERQTALLTSERRATLGVHVLLDAVPVLLRDVEALNEVAYIVQNRRVVSHYVLLSDTKHEWT